MSNLKINGKLYSSFIANRIEEAIQNNQKKHNKNKNTARSKPNKK